MTLWEGCRILNGSKEFNHILRDTRTLMVLIVMPVVMIVLFGFALSTEIKDVKVAVYDPSRDAATSRLISQIDASEYFTVTAFLDGEDGVLEAFRSNSADIALVFEDNFYRLQVIVDGSNTNIGSMAVFYVSSIVSSFQKELAQEAALNQAVAGGLSSSAEAVPSVQIHTSTRMMYNPQMKSAFNFVPGVMGMILMLHDVQSPDEECLQLRARSHGHDSHARVRDDDLGVYRP